MKKIISDLEIYESIPDMTPESIVIRPYQIKSNICKNAGMIPMFIMVLRYTDQDIILGTVHDFHRSVTLAIHIHKLSGLRLDIITN